MKKILIVGGGIAGLSSALFFSQNGYKVELIEASPKFGGRLSAFNYKGNWVDNGQHILMQCYTETVDFIDNIGAREHFEFQENLSVKYIDRKNEVFQLNIPRILFPLSNVWGLLKFDLLTFSERISVIKLLMKIRTLDTEKMRDVALKEFLFKNGQGENSISKFWEGLVVSTMNTGSNEASTALFIKMMKILFAEQISAVPIIPKSDLTRAFISPTLKVLKKNGVNIHSSERLMNLKIENNRVVNVQTSKRIIKDFDSLILAIPERGLKRLNCERLNENIPTFEYNPIVTVHIWLKRNPLKERMYNLIDGEFDWLFNHGTHLSLLKSDAKKLATINKKSVFKIAFSELKKYFTILSNIEIEDFIVLKERTATIISTLDSFKERKTISTHVSNMFVAGDWTDTGLPPTIEGAIKSSKIIYNKIHLSRFN